MRIVTALALLCPGAAFAAPSYWVAVPRGGAPIEDAAADQAPYAGHFDLRGTAGDAALRWYVDADTIFLRLRLETRPQDVGGLHNVVWGLLIDTDGADDAFELALVSETTAGLLTLYRTDGTAGLQP